MKCKHCGTDAHLEMVDFMENSNGFREKHECQMCEQHGWRTVDETTQRTTYGGCLEGDDA